MIRIIEYTVGIKIIQPLGDCDKVYVFQKKIQSFLF